MSIYLFMSKRTQHKYTLYVYDDDDENSFFDDESFVSG